MAQPSSSRTPSSSTNSISDVAIAKWTKWVAYFTAALVVSSVASNAFIYEQYSVSNTAQVDAREQARAVFGYTGVTPIAIVDATTGQPGFAFEEKFQNFGSTRTNHFEGWISTVYFEHIVPNNQDLTKPYNPVDSHDSIIAPNATAPIFASVLRSDIDKALNKQGVILLWGRVDYSDIFNKN